MRASKRVANDILDFTVVKADDPFLESILVHVGGEVRVASRI